MCLGKQCRRPKCLGSGIHVGDGDEVPGFRPLTIWGVGQQREDLSLYLSNKQKDTHNLPDNQYPNFQIND